MKNEDRLEFFQMLDDTYDLIGTGAGKVISGAAKAVFFEDVKRFSLNTMRGALAAHRLDEQRGRFTPKPADLLYQIQLQIAKDGRPSAEEAWALALTSRDEANTVIWTAEMSGAFFIANTLLLKKDDVGARMAFKESYARLVAVARSTATPAKWSVSPGTDPLHLETAVRTAVTAGRLSAPSTAALLPNYADSDDEQNASAEGLAKVKELMSRLNTMRLEDDIRNEQRKQAERDAVARRKWELNKQTRAAM